MGVFCISSALGGGLADGSDWDNAYTSITTALSAQTAAGNLFLLDSNHSETFGAAYSIDGPTSGSASFLIAVTPSATTTTQDITGIAASGTRARLFGDGAGSDDITINGHLVIYGLTLETTIAGAIRTNQASSTASCVEFYDCLLYLSGNNANAHIEIGAGGGGAIQQHVSRFFDCEFRFANAAQNIRLFYGDAYFRNLIPHASTTAVTDLFTAMAGDYHHLLVEQSDLSGFAFGELIEFGSGNTMIAIFRNIKLNASTAKYNGTLDNISQRAEFYNVGGAAVAPWEFEIVDYAGTVTSNSTIYKDASDGTNSFSHRYTPNANCGWNAPLKGPRIPYWNDGTSAITPEVHALADHGDTIDDHEVSVEWFNEASDPEGAWSTDRNSNYVVMEFAASIGLSTTGLTDTVDEANWTGETGAVQTFTFTGSFTPGQKGLVFAQPVVTYPGGVFTEDHLYVSPKQYY